MIPTLSLYSPQTGWVLKFVLGREPRIVNGPTSCLTPFYSTGTHITPPAEEQAGQQPLARVPVSECMPE